MIRWCLSLAGLLPMVALMGLFLACQQPADDDDSIQPLVGFPDDFLWGTATAGFQVDMGCPTMAPELCEDRGSDWYQFVTDPDLIAEGGLYLSGDPVSLSPGHWELYDSDFGLAESQLGTNAYRLSLEWSRLFPQPTFDATTPAEVAALADPVAVAHYHDIFASLQAHGQTPLVTINHYTLPLWIHDGKACHTDPASCSPAGWLDPQMLLPELAKYAQFAGEEFGAEVDLWATLNEPLAVVLPGYLFPSEQRTNPPGIADVDRAFQVLFAMIDGHARIYDALHEGDTADADGDDTTAEVGLVWAMATFAPMDPSDPEDVEGTEHAYQLYNRVFLDGTILGDLDLDLDGTVDEHRDDLAGRMDYLGINYYNRVEVMGATSPLFPGYELFDFFPATFLTYATGMYDAVMLGQEYGLPMIIAENGADDQGGGDEGPEFLVPHLMHLRRAIHDGADVRGYFYWSLLDNYEWNHGMGMDFGLFAVDTDDPAKARTPKLNVSVYRDIIEANDVPGDLEEIYGGE
jgi:beta-galactosidase